MHSDAVVKCTSRPIATVRSPGGQRQAHFTFSQITVPNPMAPSDGDGDGRVV
jgi:hypothetical protein